MEYFADIYSIIILLLYNEILLHTNLNLSKHNIKI